MVTMKRLSIEIPTCSPDMFEKFYQDNFKFLSLIKDDIVININFQNYSDVDIEKYISYIQSLGIEVFWCKSEYVKCISFIDLRENTHNCYNQCPYVMIFDDDIHIKSEKYISSLRSALDILDENDKIGAMVFRRRNILDDDLFVKYSGGIINTSGGIIVRIIRNDNKLHDPIYLGLIGTKEDEFTVYERIIEGYTCYECCLDKDDYSHYDIRTDRQPGGIRHGWYKCNQQLIPIIRQWKKQLSEHKNKIIT